MSDAHKAILETACKASMADSFAEGEAVQFAAMQANVEKHGVEIQQWSPEMLELFRKTWEEVAAEEAANDPFFAKVPEDMKGFRNGYAIWKTNAFLPRQ